MSNPIILLNKILTYIILKILLIVNYSKLMPLKANLHIDPQSIIKSHLII